MRYKRAGQRIKIQKRTKRKESEGKSYRDQKKKKSIKQYRNKHRNYISTLVEASLVFDIAMIFLIHLL